MKRKPNFALAIATLRKIKRLRVVTPKSYKPTFSDRLR